MALKDFRAAPLPNAPAQYDPQYIRQLIRVIENYFSQLDSSAANIASSYSAPQMQLTGVTTANKNALTSALTVNQKLAFAGTLVFDTDLKALCLFDGTAWQTIGGWGY